MTWVERVMVLCVALVLALQLLAAGQHKNDHVGVDGHCPSCFLAHHVPHGLPEAEPVLHHRTSTQNYHVEPVAIHQAPVYISFLIPSSQAPPRG